VCSSLQSGPQVYDRNTMSFIVVHWSLLPQVPGFKPRIACATHDVACASVNLGDVCCPACIELARLHSPTQLVLREEWRELEREHGALRSASAKKGLSSDARVALHVHRTRVHEHTTRIRHWRAMWLAERERRHSTTLRYTGIDCRKCRQPIAAIEHVTAKGVTLRCPACESRPPSAEVAHPKPAVSASVIPSSNVDS
jgi:hypothetical protein